MVFGKIIKGYGSIFFGLLTFLLLALVCMAAGFAVTFPLWITAVTDKGLYTVLSVSVFCCGICYLLIKKILKAYKESPRRLLISFLKKFILIGGLFLAVYLVFSFQKAAAAAVLAAVFLLYGFSAFVLPQSKNKTE